MTDELFESLLYEEEGTGIDFKKEQYRFVKAPDEERSELVKDILGFTNAWRRTKAYILVGVEEVRGGRSNVVGISASEHLDDHSLQQFINNLVNLPVRFNYRAFCYEGMQVGIFIFDEGQQRPIYLKRDYGKLEKEKVFVRRGSSTDPSRPASPTEIAQMGAGRSRESAELLVEFAHIDRDDAIGARHEIAGEFCSMPPMQDIPDLPKAHHPFSVDFQDPFRAHNTDYYREVSQYQFLVRLCRAVRLTVKNIGEVPASNVRLEITIPMTAGILPRAAYRTSLCDRHGLIGISSTFALPFVGIQAMSLLMRTPIASALRSIARTCNREGASGRTSSISVSKEPESTPSMARSLRTIFLRPNRFP